MKAAAQDQPKSSLVTSEQLERGVDAVEIGDRSSSNSGTEVAPKEMALMELARFQVILKANQIHSSNEGALFSHYS